MSHEAGTESGPVAGVRIRCVRTGNLDKGAFGVGLVPRLAERVADAAHCDGLAARQVRSLDRNPALTTDVRRFTAEVRRVLSRMIWAVAAR